MISGNGEEGQLGHGNLNHLSTFTKVEGLEGHIVSQVACGDLHTIVLTSKGTVYSFGSNVHGKTGHGVTLGKLSTPKRVIGCLEWKKVVFVAANGHHTACITENGDTYTWGNGEHGQLGHGDKRRHSTPKLVEGLAEKKAKQVTCGGHHTIVCTEDGRIYSFGNGEYHGQLGHCDFDNKFTPTLVEVLKGKCVVQVVCGWKHSMALTSEGRLYTWGCGIRGQLGHGSELDYCVPSIVECLIDYKIAHIGTKNSHSVALVNSKRSLTKKMKAMVNDETCSDVVFLLKDGDERINANRGLLIGQSEYFRAMFRSGMKESISNEVEVRDCSKGVFLLFLEYLYSGEVDIGMDNTIELYVLSDRYQEDDLKRQCIEVIEGGLSHGNAIEFLVEADGLGLDTLKGVCMEYVVSNYGQIEKENIKALSPSLMAELLINIGERHF
jgi:hypothetical protein